DEHRARAALRAVAADLGAGQTELVAQRHGERFLLHHVDAAHLAVDVERNEPLDRAGRGGLAEDFAAGAEQVRRRRGDGAAGDDTFDEGAPRDAGAGRVRLIHLDSCKYGWNSRPAPRVLSISPRENLDILKVGLAGRPTDRRKGLAVGGDRI